MSAHWPVNEEKDGRGQAAYDPAMMVRVLLYGYCMGSYSSRKIQAKTYENTSGTGSLPDAQGDRGAGVRADQRVAWVPTVPAARIAEGTSGMETDLSHPQFAQTVPLRPSLADVVRKQEEKPRIGCKKGCCGLTQATNGSKPGFNFRFCRCSKHLEPRTARSRDCDSVFPTDS